MSAKKEGDLSTADIVRATEDDLQSRRAPEEPQPPVRASHEPAPGPRDEPERPRAHTIPLFLGEEAASLRTEWDAIQTGFVDEPRQAVERADGLVARVTKRLAEGFAGERGRLEEQWTRGGDVSTEDLRLALRRYRSFFDRLLSI
jgi:hypothetical protein